MILLLRLISLIPLPILHGLGILLGWMIYLAPGRHSARLRENIRLSGICADPAACRRLLRRSIAETGKTFIELAPVWLRPYDKVLKLVREVRGWEHVEQALALGKGVVVLTPHIGSFEILNQYYASRHPCTVMFKPQPQAWLNRLILASRQRGQSRLVSTDQSGIKAMLAALKRGETIGILPDQVASKGDGVWAKFLGRPAYTPTLIFRLASSTDATFLMIYAERLAWGRGFCIHVKPLPRFPEDRTQAATLLNQAVEEVVRALPAQYFWSYNRHKRPGRIEPPPMP
jgi:Kdo2-lipid IVA lauroyltransferase/acyltransferase